MKYLCLVYNGEDPANLLSDSEQQVLVDEHLDYDEGLRKCGRSRNWSDQEAEHVTRW